MSNLIRQHMGLILEHLPTDIRREANVGLIAGTLTVGVEVVLDLANLCICRNTPADTTRMHQHTQ